MVSIEEMVEDKRKIKNHLDNCKARKRTKYNDLIRTSQNRHEWSSKIAVLPRGCCKYNRTRIQVIMCMDHKFGS